MSSMEVAKALTRHYVDNGNVAAVVVAGSVGRGRADAHSDLELDVYWHRPPTDEERLAPIRAAGDQVRQFWAYEPVDAEWSEELTADGVEVTVSGFTASWLEACIEQVTVDGDADVTKQMRLSVINEGTGVHGQDLIERWRLRSTRYLRNLAVAVAASYLTAEQLGAWRQWRALYARGDLLALRAACGQAAHVILGGSVRGERGADRAPVVQVADSPAGAPDHLAAVLLDQIDGCAGRGCDLQCPRPREAAR